MSFREVLKQLGGMRPPMADQAGNVLLADVDNPDPNQALLFDDGNARRVEEINEYSRQYMNREYRMGEQRKRDGHKILKRLSSRGSLLDVGTGRGELLDIAAALGFDPVTGTEVVPYLVGGRVVYAQGHALPFAAEQFDHVTCFDVLEHLIPEDVERAIAELYRVARQTVTISAGTRPSRFGDRDLHISARSVEAWEDTIRRAIPGVVLSPPGSAGGSPCWRIVKL